MRQSPVPTRHATCLLSPSVPLQLDSLVRIGASMQSPDRHLMGSRHQSPVEVLQQLLPPGWEQAVGQWDSSVNPLQSNANAEAFLSELHAEMQRQGGSQPGGGGRGRQPSHGEGQRREAGGRAGSEPPAGRDPGGRVDRCGTALALFLSGCAPHFIHVSKLHYPSGPLLQATTTTGTASSRGLALGSGAAAAELRGVGASAAVGGGLCAALHCLNLLHCEQLLSFHSHT